LNISIPFFLGLPPSLFFSLILLPLILHHPPFQLNSEYCLSETWFTVLLFLFSPSTLRDRSGFLISYPKSRTYPTQKKSVIGSSSHCNRFLRYPRPVSSSFSVVGPPFIWRFPPPPPLQIPFSIRHSLFIFPSGPPPIRGSPISPPPPFFSQTSARSHIRTKVASADPPRTLFVTYRRFGTALNLEFTLPHRVCPPYHQLNSPPPLCH